MKTKRSTLIGLLSTLLVIVTVLSSVLVFTATADSTEPETSPDHLVYASSKDELLEKNPVQPWTLTDDKWQPVDLEADTIGLAWLFIDMTVVGDYDLVAFGINGETSTNLLDYAFLEKLPTEAGEAVANAGSGYGKFETSSTYKNKITGKLYYDEIPEGTKYIGICATNWGTRVTPIQLIFDRTDKNLKDETLAYYNYPMSAVRPAMMGVDNSGTCFFETNTSYAAGTNVAIIPLDGTVFETLTFTAGNGKSTVDYAFVTEMIHRYDTIVTVDGTNVMQTADDGETVAIPDGAKYLLIRHTAAGSAIGPAVISFTNTDPVIEYNVAISSVGARLNANSGLRVTTSIPTAELAGLDDYSVGTLIYPTDKLEGVLTVETEDALNIVMTNAAEGNEYTYFSASMTNINAQNYARKFTVVSYLEVDGEYYYSTENISTSIYEAAIATYKEDPTAAYADAVRAYIDGVVVIEDGEQVMPYVGYEHALSATYKFATSNSSFNLTVTGENLTVDSLKTVIIDGTIYTGGWELVDGELVAAYSPMQDSSLSEYSYPMEYVTPADGCVMLSGENKDVYMVDPENPDHRVAFIYIGDTVFNKVKFAGHANKWMGWFFLDELPELGETIDYAADMTNIHETSKSAGSWTGDVSIKSGAKWLCVWYQDDADGTAGSEVTSYLPGGILFLK